jgi:protein-S-isoprenylcysteine O-methyltransferase Ste14
MLLRTRMAIQGKVSTLQLVFTGAYLLVWPALIFLLSGDWRWTEGWLFAVWFLTLCTGCVAWLYVKDPSLLAERYRKPGSGGQQGWDAWVVYGLALGFMSWIVLMPLDAKRFHFTRTLPAWFEIVGGALMLLSSFFFFRSFADNTFLSPLVRIQSERKQVVVSTGVYGFVRHPMYLGGALLFVGVPLLLGSSLGLGIGLAMSLLLAARIIGEEKMLTRELEGYAEYTKKVRYRLIPSIW